jgi:hypothetical protein
MEGERTSPTVPNHCESTAAESTTAESATHGARAHTTMRAHSVPATVPAAVSTSVSASVSAAATRGCNGWGKGDRRADCGDGGKGHDALSEHGSVPL